MSNKKLSVRKAAEALGIGRTQVLALIKQPCPECVDGMTHNGVLCERCHGTGMRLPAEKIDDHENSPWQIDPGDLKLPGVKNRQVGRPVGWRKKA